MGKIASRCSDAMVCLGCGPCVVGVWMGVERAWGGGVVGVVLVSIPNLYSNFSELGNTCTILSL